MTGYVRNWDFCSDKKETTKQEREKIVADSIGNIDGSSDGCTECVRGFMGKILKWPMMILYRESGHFQMFRRTTEKLGNRG